MKMGTDRMWENVLNATKKRQKEYEEFRYGQCLMIGLNDLYPEVYR